MVHFQRCTDGIRRGRRKKDQPGQDQAAHADQPAVPIIRDVVVVESAPNKASTHSAKTISRSDKIMIWLTVAIAFGGVVSAAAICFQAYEMWAGGKDTATIADASKRNATAAEGFTTAAKGINTQMGLAVGKLNAQADNMQTLAAQTKHLADEARIQAGQAKIAAEAARSAAETARDALHTSERAYVTLGIPSDDFPHQLINIPVVNSGHITSGEMKAVVNEVTFSIANPGATTHLVDKTTIIEMHWREARFSTVPVGTPFSVEVDLPKAVQAEFVAGKQGIMIATELLYNDGFPDTPLRTWAWCDVSGHSPYTHINTMRPCKGADAKLRFLEKLDGYPGTGRNGGIRN